MKHLVRNIFLAFATCGLFASCIEGVPFFFVDYELAVGYKLDGTWKLVGETVTTTIDGSDHEDVVNFDYDYTLTFRRDGRWKAVSVEYFDNYNKRTEQFEGIYRVESEEDLTMLSGGVEKMSRQVHIDNINKENLTLSYDEVEEDYGIFRHFVATFKKK